MSKKTGDDVPLLDCEYSDFSTLSSDNEVRIVLVGKTGAGKSATGNFILNKPFFEEGASPISITAQCASGYTSLGGRRICVVDSPGLFGSVEEDNVNMEDQIKDCVRMSLPGPHAFLLVIKVGRFTEEEKNTVNWICENFGEDASLYTIILFTHTDQLWGKPLNDYIKESRALMRFIDKCGGRYFGFDNVGKDQSQVTRLLEKINDMVERNGGRFYSNEMFQKAQEEIIEREREENRRKRKEKIKEVALGTVTAIGVGGAVAGGVAIGVTGAVVLPAVGAVAGGALAVGTGAKLAYDKFKNKTESTGEETQ